MACFTVRARKQGAECLHVGYGAGRGSKGSLLAGRSTSGFERRSRLLLQQQCCRNPFFLLWLDVPRVKGHGSRIPMQRAPSGFQPRSTQQESALSWHLCLDNLVPDCLCSLAGKPQRVTSLLPGASLLGPPCPYKVIFFS